MLRDMMMLMKKAPVVLTYATWDAATKNSNVTLSNGNLTANIFATTGGVKSTISKTSGKWYWELTINTVGSPSRAGVYGPAGLPASQVCGHTFGELGAGWDSGSGSVYSNNSIVGTNSTYGNTDVLSFDYDAGANLLYMRKNNVAQAYTFPTPSGCFAGWGREGTATANFGATAFVYSPLAGHNAGLYD